MKKLSILFLTLIITTPAFSAEIGSPQSVKIKFYEFWISPNADCSDMTQIYNETSPSYQDVVVGPTFGSPTVTNGTYPCVAYKISDVVKLTPNFNSDSGNCQTGVEITRDLFRGGDVSQSPTGTVINGSGTNPSSQVENTMYIYLATSGNNTTNTGQIPSQPALLTTPFVVSGATTGPAVFDFTNGIEDTGGSCSPETVSFSFR
jgi:hypothetical protein